MHYIESTHLIAVIMASARITARIPQQCNTLPRDIYDLYKGIARTHLYDLMTTIRRDWPTFIPLTLTSKHMGQYSLLECDHENRSSIIMHEVLAALRDHESMRFIAPQIIRLHSIFQWLNTLELCVDRTMHYIDISI